jgi:hypothetical protein
MSEENIEKLKETVDKAFAGVTKRAGQTKITSISLSKEFRSFMEDFNISPTEAVRKGVAIILYDNMEKLRDQIKENKND